MCDCTTMLAARDTVLDTAGRTIRVYNECQQTKGALQMTCACKKQMFIYMTQYTAYCLTFLDAAIMLCATLSTLVPVDYKR